MLGSLPPLGPSDANDLWYIPLSAPTNNFALNSHAFSDPSSSRQQHNHQNPHHHRRNQPPSRTLLSELRQDENAVVARKGNIRRFGAGWLKPPGITKTLQALDDEKAEREEQELNAQREAALAEAQAAQEEAEAEARRAQLEAEGVPGGEQDLDAEIPEAEEQDYDADEGDDGREGDGWEDDEGDGLTPLEGEGDYTLEEVGMDGEDELGMNADLDAGMMDGRDLDEEVPEAGSYEHTDTEEEDDDSENGEAEISLVSVASRRMTPAQRAVAGPGSVGITGSEVFGSSPVSHAQYGRRVSGRSARSGRSGRP